MIHSIFILNLNGFGCPSSCPLPCVPAAGQVPISNTAAAATARAHHARRDLLIEKHYRSVLHRSVIDAFVKEQAKARLDSDGTAALISQQSRRPLRHAPSQSYFLDIGAASRGRAAVHPVWQELHHLDSGRKAVLRGRAARRGSGPYLLLPIRSLRSQHRRCLSLSCCTASRPCSPSTLAPSTKKSCSPTRSWRSRSLRRCLTTAFRSPPSPISSWSVGGTAGRSQPRAGNDPPALHHRPHHRQEAVRLILTSSFVLMTICAVCGRRCRAARQPSRRGAARACRTRPMRFCSISTRRSSASSTAAARQSPHPSR